MTRSIIKPTKAGFQDLTGQVFHSLAVLEYTKKRGRSAWVCRCECGSEIIVTSRDLKTGNTKSCGCQRSKLISARNKTHGESVSCDHGKESPEYRTWANIIHRCHNSNSKSYSYYGGRGIAVCERWRKSYEAFLEDMGRRPSKQHTIDRIYNDLGYSPENCRWATRAEQNQNRRSNVLITFQGETKILAEWERTIGVPPGTLSKRLRSGWSIEKALSK